MFTVKLTLLSRRLPDQHLLHDSSDSATKCNFFTTPKTFQQKSVMYRIILWRAAWKPEYLKWIDRPLLRNVYNQNAYFSGNGIRTCSSFRGNEYANYRCVGNAYVIGR
jgi:hypothetical protein